MEPRFSFLDPPSIEPILPKKEEERGASSLLEARDELGERRVSTGGMNRPFWDEYTMPAGGKVAGGSAAATTSAGVTGAAAAAVGASASAPASAFTPASACASASPESEGWRRRSAADTPRSSLRLTSAGSSAGGSAWGPAGGSSMVRRRGGRVWRGQRRWCSGAAVQRCRDGASFGLRAGVAIRVGLRATHLR